MALDTTTEVLYQMKEYYGKFVADVRNLEPKLLERFETDKHMKYDSGGKYFTYPAEMEGGESVGAYREGGVLPGGPTGSIALVGDQPRINVKLIAFTHRVSGLARASIQRGPKAFFDTQDWAIKKKTQIARNDMSRQCYGNGRGILGVLAANATAANPSVVTFEAGTNMQAFAPTMRVDFWDPTLVTRRNNTGTTTDNTTEDVGHGITAVNREALTITMDKDLTAAGTGGGADDPVTGDVVVRENVGIGNTATSEGNELVGLRALIQDGDETTTLQNIAFATFPEWAAVVDNNGGANRVVTEDLLQKNFDDVQIRSGKEPDMLIMGHGQRRQLLRIGLSNVRQVATKLKLGYTVLTWNGINLFVDRHCPFNTIFMLFESNVCRFVVKNWGSLDVQPGGERIEHQDAYEFAFGTYFNLGVKAPNCAAKIEDLTEP